MPDERKTEKGQVPMAALDGPRVREIREAKKLTQLYVASVVGVTTDTISRWENNRYPSVRRDNVDKLAQALEVTPEEILRGESPPAPEAAQPRRRTKVVPVAVVVAVTAAVAAVLLLTLRPAPPPAARRIVPHFAAPGEVIPVEIRISRAGAGMGGFVLREQLPRGWTLVQAKPAPASAGTEVKWLLPEGNADVVVLETVRVPATAAIGTKVHFSGKTVTRGETGTSASAVGGDSDLTVAGVHWADTNGDGRIDDNEVIPAYYLSEEMKGMGLDWPQIEAIWSGQGYRFDPASRTFRVIP